MFLEIVEILSFYDLPQIMVGRDACGNQFIMLLESDNSEHGFQYLSVPCSNDILKSFREKRIDLLSIFLNSNNQYYLISTKDFSMFISQEICLEDITQDMLPAEGFFLGETDC